MIGDAKTQIVNDALNWLGNEPVTDLSDASLAQSVAAVKVLRVIERARDTVLARHGWTGALEYVTLAPATIANYTPPPAYPSVFLLPADALRVWSIDGQVTLTAVWQGWEPRWQVGTTEADGAPRLIVRGAAPVMSPGLDGSGMGYQFGLGWSSAPSSSDGGSSSSTPANGLSGVDVVYVRRADWASLDPNLADAVSMTAAARSCNSITGDAKLAMALDKKAEDKIMIAIGSESAQEGGQYPLAASIPAALRGYAR